MLSEEGRAPRGLLWRGGWAARGVRSRAGGYIGVHTPAPRVSCASACKSVQLGHPRCSCHALPCRGPPSLLPATSMCPPPPFACRNFTGRFTPRLLWLKYFAGWGALVVAENAGKHALRWAQAALLRSPRAAVLCHPCLHVRAHTPVAVDVNTHSCAPRMPCLQGGRPEGAHLPGPHPHHRHW